MIHYRDDATTYGNKKHVTFIIVFLLDKFPKIYDSAPHHSQLLYRTFFFSSSKCFNLPWELLIPSLEPAFSLQPTYFHISVRSRTLQVERATCIFTYCIFTRAPKNRVFRFDTDSAINFLYWISVGWDNQTLRKTDSGSEGVYMAERSPNRVLTSLETAKFSHSIPQYCNVS